MDIIKAKRHPPLTMPTWLNLGLGLVFVAAAIVSVAPVGWEMWQRTLAEISSAMLDTPSARGGRRFPILDFRGSHGESFDR
jgi:O-antigen ligase